MLWTSPAEAQMNLWQPGAVESVNISAEAANRWTQGAYEVWLLRGNCRIGQGTHFAGAREAVVWIERPDPSQGAPSKAIVYLEGDVKLNFEGQNRNGKLTDQTWFGRFFSRAGIEVHAERVEGAPEKRPALYERAMARRNPIADGAIRRAQFVEPIPGTPSSTASSAAAGVATGTPLPPLGTRRIRAYPRSDVRPQLEWFPDRATNQWIGIIDGGVQFIVDGLEEFGSIDVSTDRLVIWTTSAQEPNLNGGVQPEDMPLEIYMEGNITFRQGDRIIRASRMYYDVKYRRGTILDAELLTPVPKYQGLVRLHAGILRQLNRDEFQAEDAFFTSSRMGEPGYRLQVGTATLQDHQSPVLDPATGLPAVDPQTGEPLVEHERMVTADNNFLFLDGVPIFYWPHLATDLDDPSYYIRRAQFRSDNVFGTQILTTWDLYQLLGIRDKPRGTDWGLSLDYLSQRGFGHGSVFTYRRQDLFGIPGATSGLLDFWGIRDTGFDNLGTDRRHLMPEADYRFRLLGQHRQTLPENFQLSVEIGAVSDRNFLEEYYKREWNELKDQATGFELKQIRDNMSWSITGDYALNAFVTETNWAPRLDHFWMGEPIFGDAFTWYEHTNLGYARLHTATRPKDPEDAKTFAYMPWEVPAVGERLATRQEIDWPFQLGPIKVVPFALGEAAHWGQDVNGEPLDRLYWQAGVRASMPMWSVNPSIQSMLFNVNGIAHKIVFDVEASYAEATKSLDQLPLYDALDDNNLESFTRRFAVYDYGGTIPLKFDPRYYALRTGLASAVTSPSTEVADDLLAVRLGLQQRWQTKRGIPDHQRIVDWVKLDTEIALFPKADRDNFGTTAGLFDYDFRWQIGERLALLSAGIFDFFEEGQNIVTAGAVMNRPPNGSLYLGYRLLDGPIHSSVILANYSYRMSPKWVSTMGVSVDIGGNGNIGEHLSVTRIGESFLITAGANVDASRGTYGGNLTIEPRFLPKTRLGSIGGASVPVAGAYGLE